MGDKNKLNNNKKVKHKKDYHNKKSKRDNWFYKISIAAFLISTLVSMISSKILEDVNLVVAFFMLLVIIIGIIFDMIGISVTAADEAPFHAMASRKTPGARQAINLIRNANKVSSFCNDVVGDICGVLSGSIGALVVIEMSQKLRWGQAAFIGFLVTGLIASLTIGGKALGKTFAIEKSNSVVYKVSLVLSFFIKSVKRNLH